MSQLQKLRLIIESSFTSTLKDVVRVIRDDEAGHRDVNHNFDIIDNRVNSKKHNEENEIASEKENISNKEKISQTNRRLIWKIN